MRTSKIVGVAVAGLFALTLGAQQAGATMNPPSPAGITQSGSNSNSTNQSADSTAKTVQKNLNEPWVFFTVGSNRGDVKQWNDADTKAKSSNVNGTSQDLDQHQTVKPDGHKPPKDHKPPHGHKPDCDKGHGQKSYGNSSYGDKGHKDCPKPCERTYDAKSYGDKGEKDCPKPEPKPCDKDGGKDRGKDRGKDGHKPSGDVTQTGSNDNETTQNATSEAKTKQVNVNAPISVFSVGSNNGDVKQSNDADTSAKSSNENGTAQDVDQNQSVKGNGSGDVSQDGHNSNETNQNASSEAKTEQTNINVPISLFSVGSNNGDVHQSNDADTSASSKNHNFTDQDLDQNQKVDGGGRGGYENGGYNKGDDGKGGPKSSDVSQSGSNSNSTDQNATSTATTKQYNVNAPISLFSVGSNNGDVHQGNSADTHAASTNQNGTSQSLGQTQLVGLLG